MAGWFLTRLPEWTTWGLLLATAAYDIFAVLTPKGPLKMLIEVNLRFAVMFLYSFVLFYCFSRV